MHAVRVVALAALLLFPVSLGGCLAELDQSIRVANQTDAPLGGKIRLLAGDGEGVLQTWLLDVRSDTTERVGDLPSREGDYFLELELPNGSTFRSGVLIDAVRGGRYTWVNVTSEGVDFSQVLVAPAPTANR